MKMIKQSSKLNVNLHNIVEYQFRESLRENLRSTVEGLLYSNTWINFNQGLSNGGTRIDVELKANIRKIMR